MPSYDVFIKSWFIQETFLKSDFFYKSKTIGLYYPTNNEVHTFRIINRSQSCSKKVYLPIIKNNEINFAEFISYGLLKGGKFEIMEPLDNKLISLDEIDIIITPGIVFDRLGYRIGYGKGFYDKLFEKNHNKKKYSIGLAYDFQILDEIIERDIHDKRVDVIITNKELIVI